MCNTFRRRGYPVPRTPYPVPLTSYPVPRTPYPSLERVEVPLWCVGAYCCCCSSEWHHSTQLFPRAHMTLHLLTAQNKLKIWRYCSLKPSLFHLLSLVPSFDVDLVKSGFRVLRLGFKLYVAHADNFDFFRC